MATAGSMHGLFLSTNSDAIDVSFGTKSDAVQSILRDYDTTPQWVGAVGDSANDLPFLRFPGLLAVGAPANAQPRVLKAVKSATNGFIARNPGPDGFAEFYERCRVLGAHMVISDRDGVLRWKNTPREHDLVSQLFSHMGQNGAPWIVVLTGSSIDQNEAFVEEYGIARAVKQNPLAAGRFQIYAENGNVRIDAGTMRSERSQIDKEAETFLTTTLRQLVVERIQTDLLPKYGFSLGESQRSSLGSVILPPKQTMLTINIPRYDQHGQPFRDDPRSDAFRADLSDLVARVMGDQHVAFERI